MSETYLKDILCDDNLCGPETDVVLKCREEGKKSWQTVVGGYMDDHILRWMDCIVVAGRWEVGKPFQIAVEGKPHEWGTGKTN